MIEEQNELLTVSEMAARLKVKTSWLYRQTMQHGSGSIPRIKIGKYLRFEPEKVMPWVRRLQNMD
jgi:excisionase family DNA binding protein